jgi:hypothetical protein
MVPRAGVEPARPFGQRILSPQRLPFRHPGILCVTRILASLSYFREGHLNRDAYERARRQPPSDGVRRHDEEEDDRKKQ